MENLNKYIKNIEKYNIFYINEFSTKITLKDENNDFNKADFIDLIKNKKYDILANNKKFNDKVTELEVIYKLEWILI